MGDNDRNPVEWLKVLVAIFAAIAAIVVYLYIAPGEHAWRSLLEHALPHVIVILLAIPAIYFLLVLPGVDRKNTVTFSTDDVTAIAKDISTRVQHMGGYQPTTFPTSASRLYETFRHVDWPELLRNCTGHVDIVVYYFDSWVNTYHEHLVALLRKPAVSITVYLADPQAADCWKTIRRLFPGVLDAALLEKVTKTGQRFAKAARDAGGDPERVQLRYCKYPLQYSAQCLDNRILILSLFEAYREEKIDSPAIVIELDKYPSIATWWQKELRGLNKDSRQMPLSTA